MAETLIQTHGVEICAETFGHPTDPAVLLIMGATASMVWWPERFCRRLAEAGRFVIRYDHRDTGRSTVYPPGTVNYTLDDMADDALAVIDSFGVQRAHVAGMSLGGIIAQLLAMRDPERVLTLTVMSSTPYSPVEPALPGMAEEFLAYFSEAATLDWTDEPAVIDHMVGSWREMGGPGHVFDEALIRAQATLDVSRARNLLSMHNHALMENVPLPERDMGGITAPTLVMHGTHDPVLPYPHGEAIARLIPHARLLTLEGTGHELHPDDWARMVAAIVDHTDTLVADAQG
jgi:pimeloyl-ACP methyl ester carboxylesterase